MPNKQFTHILNPSSPEENIAYYSALRMLRERRKGQLYSSIRVAHSSQGQLVASTLKGVEYPATYVGDGETHTFWRSDSPILAETIAVANELGFDPSHMTLGRLANRFLIEKVGLIPHKYRYTRSGERQERNDQANCGFFSPRYRQIATAQPTWHWHFLLPQPQGEPLMSEPEWLVELDAKGAYFSSLLNGSESLLLEEDRTHKLRWRDDGGMLHRLKDNEEFFASHKRFRLVLLGILAKHQIQWQKFQAGEVVAMSVPDISWGAAFNSTHAAIVRLWKQMAFTADRIANGWMVRANTDGFFLKASTPPEVLESLYRFWTIERGYELRLKRWGFGYAWDCNTGVLIRPNPESPSGLSYAFIGNQQEVLDELQLANWYGEGAQKPQLEALARQGFPQHLLERWHRMSWEVGHTEGMDTPTEGEEIQQQGLEQD